MRRYHTLMRAAHTTMDKAQNSRNHGHRAGSLPWILLFAVPGIGIKRWLLLGMVGIVLIGSGIAFILSIGLSQPFVSVIRAVTLGNVLSPVWRGAIIGAIGLAVSGAAAFMLYERLAFGARYSRGADGIVESLASHRTRKGGPNLVAIGGGTGLSVLLRGLKHQTDHLTAVFTPADDGGSTGRLREMFGIPPLGDARQCLIALSDAEPLMERVLSFRFDDGDGLAGHSLGNLLLSAMVTSEGGFGEGLESAHDLLAVRGRVTPSSQEPGITLEAETESGRFLSGESAVSQAGEPIASLWLTPRDAEASPAAVAAIREADAIIIGPGSLYTSILPNLLIGGLAEAVRGARCPKIFVCNVATQHMETDGMGAGAHLAALDRHGGIVPTHFVMNGNTALRNPAHQQQAIAPETPPRESKVVPVIEDLIDESSGIRHDPAKLARVILSLVKAPRRR